MTAAARGSATVGRWFVASMVCALVAHAAVYRSLVPDDGLHGYFGWYVPLVAVASLGSLLAVVVGGLCRSSRAGTADPALSACALDHVSRRDCRLSRVGRACVPGGSGVVGEVSRRRRILARDVQRVDVAGLVGGPGLGGGCGARRRPHRCRVDRAGVQRAPAECPDDSGAVACRQRPWCGSEVCSARVARRFACASSRGLISRAPEGRSSLPETREGVRSACRSHVFLDCRFVACRLVAVAAALGTLALPAVAEAHSSAPGDRGRLRGEAGPIRDRSRVSRRG